MYKFDPTFFVQVHRQLFDLYGQAGAGSGRATRKAVTDALKVLSESISGSDCVQSKTCFQRYVRLISARWNDEKLLRKFELPDVPQSVSRSVAAAGKPEALTVSDAQPALRLLVSGIGRSGTTMIYQQLAKLLLAEGLDINFRYEPYLWNIHTPIASGNPFDMGQLHQMGLYTHRETPLFLDGAHPLHDRFLDHLFAEASDRTEGRAPDACLTKVIRGSGRLAGYVGRFPDIKIVACLRNPFDTINSSLGMFSFFGEEFHADDRPRFVEALSARGLPTDHLSFDTPRGIEWYAAWWRVFTEETMRAARRFPDNVFLYCHEDFRRDRARVFGALQDFVGLHNAGMNMGLGKPAGPSIKATSLTAWDVSYLAECQDYYEGEVLLPLMGPRETARQRAAIVRRYAEGEYSLPIAGSDAGRAVPIQLRGLMMQDRATPFLRTLKGKRTEIDLPALIKEHAGHLTEGVRTPFDDPAALKKGNRFGAVVTCHNNADTVVDSVLSCLAQTLPYDRILVVDDNSSDGSLEKLNVLAEMYSAVQVLPLQSSLGPSGARHLGISRLDTDYWTQLDGDDLFWPTKNECEARALNGETDVVAFSDVLLVEPNKSRLQDTDTYTVIDQRTVFNRLLARQPQIPRDMTLSRELYFKAGGYNLASHLYEDWDFKLRLAGHPDSIWRRSDSLAGTVYNRLCPGLSAANPGLHARALVLFFFKALGQSCVDGDPDLLLERFDTALKPFRDRQVTATARRWLAAALASGRFAPQDFADFATARATHSLPNESLSEVFKTQAAALEKLGTSREVAAQ